MTVSKTLISIIDVIGMNTLLFSFPIRMSPGRRPNQFSSHGAN